MPSFASAASKKEEIDVEKRAVLRRMQSEHQIFEQDFQKKRRYQEGLTMEIRRIGMERDRLELHLGEKSAELEKLSRELGMLEAEGKHLKRKINLLS